MKEQINFQINAVVEARARAREATGIRTVVYQKWLAENQSIFDGENKAKVACQEAETKLREEALKVYAEVGDKTVAPGIGIRVVTKLLYESKEAMDWAVKHELALKLDTSVFEKIAKTNGLPFVTISTEPQATISQDLQIVKEE